jgi:L-ascorbate metabolism protein UlaG (beta-lactamase superfamily)
MLQLAGLRLLTDPTFDPGGSEYKTPVYTLLKNSGPAIAVADLDPIDVVLLSHDHHFDNLDRAGRRMLERAGRVITTVAGAGRLGDNAIGLLPWQRYDVPTPDGRTLHVTATPARHGPPDGDRGPVVGFVLVTSDEPETVVYVSGDTVWYEGVTEVAARFTPDVVLLFAGAARVAAVGSAHLTMTADEAVTAAKTFAGATIVPLHFEGWAHFSESRAEIERAFRAAGLDRRLVWPVAGEPVEL